MLPAELLENLFPFHLALSKDLSIHSAGSSLAKMQPSLNTVTNIFEVLEFRNPINLDSFAALKAAAGERVEITIGPDKPNLTGQLAYCEVGDVVYFLGSPVIDNPIQLSKLNLSIDDFAPHDASVGMMFLRHFQAMQLSEAQEVSTRLQESRQVTEKLRQTEERLLEDLHAACDIYIRFTSDGTVTDVRSAKSLYLPHPRDKIIGKNLYCYLDTVENFVQHYDHLSVDGGMVRYDSARQINGQKIHFSVRLARTQDDQYLLVARDITDRERQRDKLNYQANHDELTGLANRRRFNERLTQAIRKLNNNAESFAVMTIDLDDFKQVNDIFGHSAGDFVLKVIAKRLSKCLRSEDLAARLGGDEFCLLLTGVQDENMITSLADRVLSSLSGQIGSPFGNINIGATVGMVIPDPDDTIDEVFRSADLAMYEAKSKGKNCIAWYSPELRSRYQQ